jgi:hypothetical protein
MRQIFEDFGPVICAYARRLLHKRLRARLGGSDIAQEVWKDWAPVVRGLSSSLDKL